MRGPDNLLLLLLDIGLDRGRDVVLSKVVSEEESARADSESLPDFVNFVVNISKVLKIVKKLDNGGYLMDSNCGTLVSRISIFGLTTLNFDSLS